MRGKITRLVITKEKDEITGLPVYVCVYGSGDLGTLAMIKADHVHLSPDVFDMIISDMTEGGNA